MRPAFIFAFSSLFFCNPALSEPIGGECRSIEDDTKRLECFDNAFTSAEVKAQQEKAARADRISKEILAESQRKLEVAKAALAEASYNSGDWLVDKQKSPIDDSQNVYLTLQSASNKSCRFKSAPHSLRIRCKENTTALTFNFGGCFMSDLRGGGKVTYRVDNKKASSIRTRESTDHQVLGLWSGGSSIPFIKKLLSGEKLLVRAVPFNDSPVTSIYNIAGLSEAIKPLRKACSW